MRLTSLLLYTLYNSLIPTPTIVVTNASTKLDAWKGKKGLAFLAFLGKSSSAMPGGRSLTVTVAFRWGSPDRRYLAEFLLVDVNCRVWSRQIGMEVEVANIWFCKVREESKSGYCWCRDDVFSWVKF